MSAAAKPGFGRGKTPSSPATAPNGTTPRPSREPELTGMPVPGLAAEGGAA